MSTVEGFDRAAQYVEKLEKFRQLIPNPLPSLNINVIVETGRKFDKLVMEDGMGPNALYMVDRHTWDIYGVKSWTQVNLRRWYGTLDTIDQMDWSTRQPLANTDLARAIEAREAGIKAKYGKRGRPPKAKV